MKYNIILCHFGTPHDSESIAKKKGITVMAGDSLRLPRGNWATATQYR